VSNLILRQSNALELFAAGKLPDVPAKMDAVVERLEAKDHTLMGETDVAVSFCNGGCGYGDPLLRDPELVARDVRHGLVSDDMARAVYGVVVVDGGVSADDTGSARAEIRATRLRESVPVDPSVSGERIEGGEVIHPVTDGVEAVRVGDDVALCCKACRQRLGAYDEEYKRGTLVRELPVTFASPLNSYGLVDEFFIREFCCPGCGTVLAMNVQQRGEPIVDEVRFFAAS
jgi:N-methylhydantoinase B